MQKTEQLAPESNVSERTEKNDNLTEDLRNNVISQVKEKLGKPKKLVKFTASHLWDKKWRVNVWCQFENEIKGIMETKIGHSFFLDTDKNGTILHSEPKIVKLYN